MQNSNDQIKRLCYATNGNTDPLFREDTLLSTTQAKIVSTPNTKTCGFHLHMHMSYAETLLLPSAVINGWITGDAENIFKRNKS